MSTIGAAPRAVSVSNARAEASRKNGAGSRGPKTPAGKARASQNALKHGLRAARHVVLPDEDVAAFAALEAALLAELAPVGALQRVLAGQIVSAAWRLARVDRMEAEVLIFRQRRDADLGLAVIRDGNSSRTVPTLLRYRGAAQAEFLRSLRTLQALQAAAAKPARVAGPAAVLTFEPGPGRAAAAQGAPGARARHREPRREPNEPEPRGDLGSAPAARAAQIDATAGVTRARRNEPERPAAASLLQQSATEPTGPEALAESARVRPREPEQSVAPPARLR